MPDSRVVIAPDSFKGSLEAPAVARALAEGLAAGDPALQLDLAPLADGGEGTLAAMAAARPGRWRAQRLEAIHGQSIEAPWYAIDGGPAVIESATVLGLPLIEAAAAAPPLATRGSGALGMLLRAALDAGARDIAIGLGGSACNDAGLGLLIALGAVARDAAGRSVAPTMNGLLSLAELDLAGLDPRLASTRLRILCDVDNPLLGDNGASRVYGPQKGLDADAIAAVEAAFTRLAHQGEARGLAERPGSGAAGGLGFACALIGGRLESGAEAILDITGLPARLAAARCVITGEGRSDRQTLSGKLPLAVARTAAPRPAILVSGAVETGARDALERHFRIIRTLVDQAGSVEAALAEPARWLTDIGRALAPVVAKL